MNTCRGLLCAAVVAIVALAPARPTRAAGIAVTSLAQSPGAAGDCTLGEAIVAANTDRATDGCTAGSGADVIALLPGTYTLSGANNPGNGLPVITSTVTIEGNGATIVRASAFKFRVLRIDAPGNLTLNHLTISAGTAPLGVSAGASSLDGGGIANTGTLTLNDSTLSGNSAVNGAGGGIHTSAGSVTLNRSTLSGNSAVNGGAIYNDGGSVVLNGSTLSDNDAEYGGGVFNFNHGTLALTSSAIGNSTAGRDGGGIFNSGGTLTLVASTISGNRAVAGSGGGISNGLAGEVTIVGGSVGDNTATGTFGTGGGIYNSGGELTVTNGAIVGNAAYRGGGIFNETTLGSVTLTGSQVRGNQATAALAGSGGGIYNDSGSLALDRSIVADGVAKVSGGGIYNDNGTLNVTRSAIIANAAGAEGGGLANRGAATLTNSTFSANQAVSGGGIANGDATTRMSNVTVAANTATTGDGGGIYASAGAITLKNSILATNADEGGQAPDCAGSGITSAGYSLVGSSAGCGFTPGASDRVGLDTRLAPLDAVGTHPLLVGSPAIEGGAPSGCTDSQGVAIPTDQRGVARPVDGDLDGIARCDIGAYEFEPRRLRYLPMIMR